MERVLLSPSPAPVVDELIIEGSLPRRIKLALKRINEQTTHEVRPLYVTSILEYMGMFVSHLYMPGSVGLVCQLMDRSVTHTTGPI
jgi:hypothetical protein